MSRASRAFASLRSQYDHSSGPGIKVTNDTYCGIFSCATTDIRWPTFDVPAAPRHGVSRAFMIRAPESLDRHRHKQAPPSGKLPHEMFEQQARVCFSVCFLLSHLSSWGMERCSSQLSGELLGSADTSYAFCSLQLCIQKFRVPAHLAGSTQDVQKCA